jgi:hypothetical protein
LTGLTDVSKELFFNNLRCSKLLRRASAGVGVGCDFRILDPGARRKSKAIERIRCFRIMVINFAEGTAGMEIGNCSDVLSVKISKI